MEVTAVTEPWRPLPFGHLNPYMAYGSYLLCIIFPNMFSPR